MFTTLIAVGAFIRIPVPVCPFTLQFLFTCLAGALLGPRRGAISVLVYIALGLTGLPIFAEGGGIWYVMKPTFGYLIGFVIGTFVTGYMVQKLEPGMFKSSGKNSSPVQQPAQMAMEGPAQQPVKRLTMPALLSANFAGLAIVYLVGMIYCYLISNFVLGTPLGLWPLFLYCFVFAVPGDICLCVLAAILTRRLKPALKL